MDSCAATMQAGSHLPQLQKNNVSLLPGDKTRVAVAMSGGVDSSTTALILKQEGYDVIGVTGWLIKSGSRCCDTGMIDAAKVCQQLEIEHHAVDLREMFKAQIVDEFPKSYARAQTPLPCSVCNTLIKWGALLNYGKKVLGASYIATGHYGRVIREGNDIRLARAVDLTKDQSYVLWGLTREQLQVTLLPLGNFRKDEIRAIAFENHLASAERPDSQDLCFIPEGLSTQEYLAKFLPEAPGPIIHSLTGTILGQHQGTYNFTIGQRKGLGISASEPLYVTFIDPDARTVYAGPKSALLRRELIAHSVNWIVAPVPDKSFSARAKVRYNSPAVPAIIKPMSENVVQVEFEEAQTAITPGQVLAIYDTSDNFVLGGGWIE
jgi:tRNA-uridine 2-sulfurtransferase